jgi:hypothetical protein
MSRFPGPDVAVSVPGTYADVAPRQNRDIDGPFAQVTTAAWRSKSVVPP